MSALLYYLLVKPLSLLPLPVLYLFSDVLYVVLYHLMKYRKTVVHNNLKNSFPDKSPKEIESIMRRFYRHFCDLIAESIRFFSISEAETVRRCRVKNPELLDALYREGRSVLIIAGHYNNWELGALAFVPQVQHQCAGIYQPLRNPFFNEKMRKSRGKYGLEMVSKKETKEYFAKDHDKPVGVMFGADQSPTFSKKVYWMDFLSQETAVAFGTEKYAKEYNYIPVFCRIKKLKRGYYEVDIETITESPRETAYGEITEKHTRMLEQQIEEDPAYWLWTHKRWKRKRQAAEV